jgi:hypothetical protein
MRCTSLLITLLFSTAVVAQPRDAGSTEPSNDNRTTNSQVFSAAASARAAGQFADAAYQYREFAVATPEGPQAAEAHRFAILCIADLLRETPSADRDRIAKSYETLIAEHLRIWPSEPSADDVRMWQARLLAARRDWPATITALQNVRPASPHYADSIRLLADAFDRQLGRLHADNEVSAQERARLLAAATRHLQPIITGPDNRWPNAWSDAQRTTATSLAKLHVRYAEASSPYAAQLLYAALREMPAADESGPSAEWKTTARSLLVAALARNGKTAEAQQIAAELDGNAPTALLDALTIVVEGIPPTAVTDKTHRDKGQLAQTLLRHIEAHQSELDADAMRRLNYCRAAVLAAIGDRSAAVAHYAALAESSPDDGEVQERYAALLAASDNADELRQSLSRWQLVESRSRRGNDRWRRARAARIQLLTRLGETGEAEKLAQLTKLLYPNWDSAAANTK